MEAPTSQGAPCSIQVSPSLPSHLPLESPPPLAPPAQEEPASIPSSIRGEDLIINSLTGLPHRALLRRAIYQQPTRARSPL
ncbi:hypothetical protein J4Q44_G00335050 [Coregonus suidteri]|uniref:Uncharacterized protein n=1 Tax=Coregonus suidteri TaxID=861788 RepID=A0AAN8QN25_9TELE